MSHFYKIASEATYVVNLARFSENNMRLFEWFSNTLSKVKAAFRISDFHASVVQKDTMINEGKSTHKRGSGKGSVLAFNRLKAHLSLSSSDWMSVPGTAWKMKKTLTLLPTGEGFIE